VNLKTLGGGMMKYKRLSMRRKNVTNVYITTRVMKTYRSTKKLEETQKKTVSEAGSQAYTELYRKLDTKEGVNDVYKMTKFRERKTKDFHQVKCIKDEADRFFVKDEEIKKIWRAYFDKIFNDESEKTAIELDDSIDTNRRFVRRIQESEVK
jgi:hypothetical protein